MSWNDAEVKEKLKMECGLSDKEATFLIKARKIDMVDTLRKKKVEDILAMLKDKEDE